MNSPAPNRLPVLVLGLICSLMGAEAAAGSLSVSPIRVDLGAGQRAGAITVSNDDAAPLRVQARLMRWTQDAQGQDIYTDADDLLYHPRLMVIEGKGQRLLRVGLRQPVTNTEQAYRLFIEELPAPPEPGQAGAAKVAIAVRFGVPVFVAPSSAQAKIELSGNLHQGVLTLNVHNPGNTHFRLQDISVSDASGFHTKMAGWYQLAGSRRAYKLALDPSACKKWTQLQIRLQAEELSREETFPIPTEQCGP